MIVLPFLRRDDVDRVIEQVVRHLRAGGLIAYPTETVYGFGTLVRDDALDALSALKSRDIAKPFLLLIRDVKDAPPLDWTPAARRLAAAFWPGPLTIALRGHSALNPRIISEDQTVAVRATPHEAVRALLTALEEPITSTSANLPGIAPARSADEVRNVLSELGAPDVMVLDGGTLPESEPSTIVDCSEEPPRLLRAGAITNDVLRQVIENLA